MKHLLLLFAVCVTVSCKSAKIPKNINTTNSSSTKVRVTFYSKGEDKWGDKISSCPKKRAKVGVTAAADPNLFSYGTKILLKHPLIEKYFGDEEFLVEDTGTDVKKKKASNGKTPVIDLYVERKSRIRFLEQRIPYYLDLKIK